MAQPLIELDEARGIMLAAAMTLPGGSQAAPLWLWTGGCP
jgi:hypothetical protein